MKPLVELDDLSLAASGRLLLDGVNLTIAPGEAVGVLGPSGSGKTTLALAVLGHLRPGVRHVGGQSYVDGHAMLPTPAPGVRGGVVGYLGQDPGLLLNPYAKVGADLPLARVGLPSTLVGRYPHQLSGGQQQRVALAIALAREPRLLVLDEPTTALDVLAKAEVLEELKRLRDSGVALLWISHDLDTVDSLVDRVFTVDGSTPTRTSVPRTPSTSDGPVALHVNGLHAGHGSNRVLKDVDLDVREGECLAILGASGVGKSTLARCLVGLHKPSDGSVTGSDIQLVPQNPAESLHPRQDVRTALVRPLRKIRGMRKPYDAEVDRLLDAVGLPTEFASRLPGELSGGQRQRVALARALAAQPKVLVCDEITSALDASTQAGVLGLLGELRQRHGLAVVFITHDAHVAAAVSDRVLVLVDGRVAVSGHTDDVLARPEDLPALLLEERPCRT
ncbi:ABC transporter ATP-binding protein [Allokutzneria multivorans]|uniref:ABC transporter ATP-binding protein n=1 Tax=Allokutzneria multivorans TaxID=1142134 RepID=A0ABP7RZV3_9PSEU